MIVNVNDSKFQGGDDFSASSLMSKFKRPHGRSSIPPLDLSFVDIQSAYIVGLQATLTIVNYYRC